MTRSNEFAVQHEEGDSEFDARRAEYLAALAYRAYGDAVAVNYFPSGPQSLDEATSSVSMFNENAGYWVEIFEGTETEVESWLIRGFVK